eukprot:GGOE01057277.1.p3 GENE.GGOE01057277.1~~GGOE01057277.1.p3  ORF type:complete len:114 (+),score=4.80 GGOE01057277.1:262-603(+)
MAGNPYILDTLLRAGCTTGSEFHKGASMAGRDAASAYLECRRTVAVQRTGRGYSDGSGKNRRPARRLVTVWGMEPHGVQRDNGVDTQMETGICYTAMEDTVGQQMASNISRGR